MKITIGQGWLVAAVCVCVLGGTYMAARATPAAPMSAPPTAPVIAMVDLPLVLEGLKEREDKEKSLKAQQAEYQTKIDQMGNDAKSDKSLIENMPDTPAKIAAAKAYREKIIRAEFEAQYAQRYLGEMKGEMLRELYLKINDAVKKIAVKSNYQLVLSNDQNTPVPPGDPEGVTRAIALKRVMYAQPDMDITNDVIAQLNNDYAAGPTGGGASATPGTKKKP